MPYLSQSSTESLQQIGPFPSSEDLNGPPLPNHSCLFREQNVLVVTTAIVASHKYCYLCSDYMIVMLSERHFSLHD